MREQYHRRWGGLLLAGLLLVLPAGGVGAAKLVDIRVGEHADFTRVVFELDEEAAFHVEPLEKGSGEVLVTLRAESPLTTKLSRGSLVEAVHISPGPAGSVAHLKLRVSRVHVTEMVLRNPHRIVLDLREMPQSEEIPASAPVEKVAPVAAPVPVEEMAEPARPIETAGEAGTSTPPAAEEASEDPALADDSLRAEEVEETELATASATHDPPATEDEPSAETDLAAAATDEEETPAAAPTPTQVAEHAAATPTPTQVAEHAAPTPTSAPTPTRVPAPATPPTSSSFFGSPYLLAGLGGILVLFVIWRMQRRKAMEPGTTSITFPPDAEPSEQSAIEGAATSPSDAPDESGSIFDGPKEPNDEKEESVEVETALATTDPRQAPVAEPLPGLDLGEVVHQLEQRISKLESRIEDLVDARERLERQVNAQTEELRVQRAAIARTQRVVRSLARPEEESTNTTPQDE